MTMTNIKEEIRDFILNNDHKGLDLYLTRHQNDIVSKGVLGNQASYHFAHECCVYGYDKCLRILLKHGTNPNTEDPSFHYEQSSPLGMALGRLHLYCVKELVLKKAHIGSEELFRALVVHNGFASPHENRFQEDDISSLFSLFSLKTINPNPLVIFKDTMRTADFDRLTPSAWKALFKEFSLQNSVSIKDMFAPSVYSHIQRFHSSIQNPILSVLQECLAEEEKGLIMQHMPLTKQASHAKKM